MSYIGRDVDNISNVEKLDNITFDGGTTLERFWNSKNKFWINPNISISNKYY